MRCFAIITTFAIVLAGCGDKVSGTTCGTDADCNLFNAQGTCESTGFCSFPDETCAGGRRYAPGAGDGLGGTCIGGSVACGHRGEVCCGIDSCGPDLTCAAGSCVCGAADQACCGGDTCEVGLGCGGSSTCVEQGFTDVAVGMGHVCALRTDKSVWCWGYDNKVYPSATGGLGVAVIANPTPELVANLADVDEIRAAEMHTCARKADRTLWCWGHNENGQLGNGTNAHSKAAVEVAGLTDVSLFDGGRLHTCAVGSYQGTAGVWCWGRNGQRDHSNPASPNPLLGRLGNNATLDSNVPVAVDLTAATMTGQTVKALSTGGYHSCVVMSDDAVWCWGRNQSGALGDGTTTDTNAPVRVDVSGIPSGVTVVGVSCSDGRRQNLDTTCIVTSTGDGYCWGDNSTFQLGDGGNADRTTPSLKIDTRGTKLVGIIGGQDGRCALDDAQNVVCWGRDQHGVLGLGFGGNSTYPVPSRVGITNVLEIDMSHRTTCAIDATKRLFCWGTNTRGQVTARPAVTDEESAIISPREIVF